MLRLLCCQKSPALRQRCYFIECCIRHSGSGSQWDGALRGCSSSRAPQLKDAPKRRPLNGKLCVLWRRATMKLGATNLGDCRAPMGLGHRCTAAALPPLAAAPACSRTCASPRATLCDCRRGQWHLGQRRHPAAAARRATGVASLRRQQQIEALCRHCTGGLGWASRQAPGGPRHVAGMLGTHVHGGVSAAPCCHQAPITFHVYPPRLPPADLCGRALHVAVCSLVLSLFSIELELQHCYNCCTGVRAPPGTQSQLHSAAAPAPAGARACTRKP